jgi:hypothetical protein
MFDSGAGPNRAWDALLQTLVDLGLTDDWQHMIDSTSVRGHGCGRKRGLVRTLLVDHAAALRAKSTPDATIKDCLGFILTGGEASDYTAAEPLMEIPVATPRGCWQTRDMMATASGKVC